MNVFEEFDSLKAQYIDLMEKRFDDAPFSENFKCIYDVLEYIYEGVESGEEADDDIYDLFQFGYRYLNEKFLYLTSLLSNVYSSDEELKANYESLDMLFYIMDFITDAELDNLDTKALTNIEDEVFRLIEMKKPISPSTNERLDMIVKEVFKKGYHSFMESFDVLYDAITFGYDEDSLDEDDENTYVIDK